MATVTLNSSVKVEKYKPFKGLNEAIIKKSIRNFCDTAVIKLPATAVMKQSGPAQTKSVLTASRFNRGDRITINLGYNGLLREEFNGFISRVNKSAPCEIECEGYAFQLRNKKVNKVWVKTTLKEVLKEIIKGTDIVLDSRIDTASLDRIELVTMSGFKALEELKKQCKDVFSFWFDGNVLYAGLAFTVLSERNKANKPDVKYKIGYNVVRENQMKERMAGQDAYEVELVFTKANGKKEKVKTGIPNSNSVRKRIQAISDKDLLKRGANELEQTKNYTGFDGKITGFLVPFCKPSNKANIEDPRYPERSGNYLVESTEVKFGTSGARRIVGISIKL